MATQAGTSHLDVPGASFQEIVGANQYMVLATSDETGLPWASPVWFATADLHDYYWVSRPDARHSANLAARPELGITIFDSQQPPGTGLGVYLSAVGGLVPEQDLDQGLATYSDASQRAGVSAWTRSDVSGRARHRLYRATALERFILSPHDERIRVAGP
jgi:hypothetical protein